MCTLTWWIESSERYEVFFNRDEKKDRPVAAPPSEGHVDGVAYLAPTDPGAGGTWIVANEYGVVFALLNGYDIEPGEEPAGGWRSRGLLVRDLASITSGEECRERIGQVDGRAYPPFRLAGFFPSQESVEVFGWLGDCSRAVSRIPPEMPMCSSSFATAEVLDARKRAFHRVVEPLEGAAAGEGEDRCGAHWRFHHDASGGADAYTVRMNRPDAQTWSVSRITITREQIAFLYEAESPGLTGAPGVSRSVLPRTA